MAHDLAMVPFGIAHNIGAVFSVVLNLKMALEKWVDKLENLPIPIQSFYSKQYLPILIQQY